MSIADQDIGEIERLAGGASNISSRQLSETCLRLSLKDRGLASVDQITSMPSVESARIGNGTLRITFASEKGQDMETDNQKLAQSILEKVGGTENVVSLAHCITRLRFKLKDESKANDAEVSSLDGVIQVMHSAGQYQVVVGAKVDDLFEELVGPLHLPNAGTLDIDEGDPMEEQEKGNLLNRFMSFISGAMGPILMPMAAAGMIKGIVAMLAATGVIATTDGVYEVLYAISDGFFYFLPILLGYTAAKKFGCNEFLGMVIGAALVYPSMVNFSETHELMGTLFAGTAFEMGYYSTFLGIPIIMPAAGYTSSVIPILLATWVASKLERFLRQHLPQLIRNFMTPAICFAVMAPLTYIVIGPVASLISSVLTMIVTALYGIPTVGTALVGLVAGGAWSTLVMFGLHWAFVPVILNNFSQLGFDPISAVTGIGGWIGLAQGIAVILKTRDAKLRGIAIPAAVSQACGVGEPMLYGVQIPKKFLFVQDIAFAAVGGLVCGALGVRTFTMGGMGVFSFPNFVNPETGDMTHMIIYLSVICVLMLVAFAFTFATYHDDGCYLVKGRKPAGSEGPADNNAHA